MFSAQSDDEKRLILCRMCSSHYGAHPVTLFHLPSTHDYLRCSEVEEPAGRRLE